MTGATTATAPSAPAPAVILGEEQDRYRHLSPIQAADGYMRFKPRTGGVRQAHDREVMDNPRAPAEVQRRKSRPKVWGDSQRRQFRAAAWLFGKSNGGKSFAASVQDDLNNFYDRLNRLPSSHHKSTRHEPMSLEEICEEAQSQIEDGTAGSFTVGLDVGTINRHFANLKKLHAWVATKTSVNSLDFSHFILVEEDHDARDERDPYTIAQGRELFRLAVWTGSASLDTRMVPVAGGQIWHDATYWVLMIVWYSGMRREEACKLLFDDIGEEDGIHYFNIRNTRAGKVKTANSVRKVPIHSEILALGFLKFVTAMRSADEDYLFPEILPGRGNRAIGDVFFKAVWLKIKPCLSLVKPGQAVHSGGTW